MHKIFTMKHSIYILAILIFIQYSCDKDEKVEENYGTVIEVPNEVTTIKRAIELANPFDTVLIHEGTYEEYDIEIDKPVFITSFYAYSGDSSVINQTVIDGNDVSRIFYISDVSDTIIISGITLTSGRTSFEGGGIYCDNSIIKLKNIIIKENNVSKPNTYGIGGGLYLNESYAYLENVYIFDNYAQETGGAIVCMSSILKVYSSGIYNNRSEFGHPIRIWGSDLYFENLIIRDNIASPEEIYLEDCTGTFKNVQIINDEILFSDCSIEFIDCNIPGY